MGWNILERASAVGRSIKIEIKEDMKIEAEKRKWQFRQKMKRRLKEARKKIEKKSTIPGALSYKSDMNRHLSITPHTHHNQHRVGNPPHRIWIFQSPKRRKG